ncbi:MAG: HPr family phosphocarrier protein [Isosphaeraceae bacterium]
MSVPVVKASPKQGEQPNMPGTRRQQVEITNELGLHLRAANRWVELARTFQSEVRVFWNGRSADGKSILDLLTLGAESGALLELEIIGPDSDEAAAALAELVANRFHDGNAGGCGAINP